MIDLPAIVIITAAIYGAAAVGAGLGFLTGWHAHRNALTFRLPRRPRAGHSFRRR